MFSEEHVKCSLIVYVRVVVVLDMLTSDILSGGALG